MNPLTDVLPDKVRKTAYAVLFVLALGFSAWQAAEGNWFEFVAGLVVTLGNAMAASNVNAPVARVDAPEPDEAH